MAKTRPAVDKDSNRGPNHLFKCQFHIQNPIHGVVVIGRNLDESQATIKFPRRGHEIQGIEADRLVAGPARRLDGRHRQFTPQPGSPPRRANVKTLHFRAGWFSGAGVKRPHADNGGDVVVGSNLFGDILSDLGPAATGTIGIAPGSNINPEKDNPSMFEPVHGSAPDIAGKGIANPIGQIWSGAMMLEHLGLTEAAGAIVAAIEKVLKSGDAKTPDMGGRATTAELAEAVEAAL